MRKVKKFEEFINESATSKELEEYFLDRDIKISKNFDIKKCVSTLASMWNYTEDQIETMLFNLEDSSVMQDIADGNFDSFDPSDSYQFNDSYEDMMDDLNENAHDNVMKIQNEIKSFEKGTKNYYDAYARYYAALALKEGDDNGYYSSQEKKYRELANEAK